MPGSKIVDEKRDLEELELRGSDVIEARGLFLLDQVFEDADFFGLRKLDNEHLIWLVIENETVEREKLRGFGSCDWLDYFSRS